MEEFYRDAARTLRDVRAAFDSTVNRIAAVVHRFVETEDPGIALATHFCKDDWTSAAGPLNRPASFELHAHKVFTTEAGLRVNSWVRNKTGTITWNRRSIVMVEQDINTLADDTTAHNYDDTSIEGFFGQMPSEFGRVLALYYPEAQGNE